MPRSTYSWKRFWYLRGTEFPLLDDGYLYDPDGQHGEILNAHAVPFDKLLSVPCLVLLGEPGMGKSTALGAWPADLHFDLGAYQSDSSLTKDVFCDARVQEWRDGSGTLSLSLDSLDEGRLAIANIVKILLREFQKLRASIDRLSLRISCRTADWPTALEEGLTDLWGEQSVGIYELAPLRRKDVIAAAEANGINSAEFLTQIRGREAIPLAIRPITLEFLLACFKRHRGFPETKARLYFDGIRGLCEESNVRRDAGWTGDLSAEMRLEFAARIAALTVLGGFSAVWTAADRGDVPYGDITIPRLSGGTEHIKEQIIAVDERAIAEVLGTALFSSSGARQLGWSHRTYAEFLAARYLATRGFAETQVMSLLTIPDEKGWKLAPQLHETAAWLASMKPEFFRQIMAIDPNVLLLSDVVTADPADREKLVDTLLKLYDEEKLLDSNWGQRFLYRKLVHPTLARQLLPYIQDRTKGIVVRRVAINFAESCNLQSLQAELTDLVRDSTQDVPTRVQAAYALTRIADSQTRSRLKPLAIQPIPEDNQDEIRGCALNALWPALLTADELFGSLTPPKVESFGGAYSHFLHETLVSSLRKEHLPAALRWLATQPPRRELGISLEKLSDRILDLAWTHADDPVVLQPLTSVLARQIRAFDSLFGDSQQRTDEILVSDSFRRHAIIEGLLPLFSAEEVHLLGWSIPWLGRGGDSDWVMERYKECADEGLKPIWLEFLIRTYDWHDQKHLTTILAQCASDSVLQNALRPMIGPIELTSHEAAAMRATYQQHEALERQMAQHRHRPLLSTPPAEQVRILLQRLEEGKLDAWWQLNLVLMLRPDGSPSDWETRGDLMQLPGWQAADADTRHRMVIAAQTYLRDGDPHTDRWLSTKTWHRPAMAGYRAFYLLLREQPGALQLLENDVWKKWAPALLAFPNANRLDEAVTGDFLLCMAYDKARDELIDTLLALIDAENAKSEFLAVTEKANAFWDSHIAAALYKKAQDPQLKPEFVATLLNLLLDHGYDAAHSLAACYTTVPIPTGERAKAIATAAASALLNHAAPAAWDGIWAAFQADGQFAHDVIARLCLHASFQGPRILPCLSNEQLADLYVWLCKMYPEAEPEDGVSWMGPQDYAYSWRNTILQILQSRGTTEACEAIRRLMQELPHLTYLKWSLQAAREESRFRAWKPVDPACILQLAANTQKRFVRDGSDLLATIMESLQRFTAKLRGETPLVANLWNESRGRGWEPKDEEHLSDNIKQHLQDELRDKGIVLNREVMIRRHRGNAKGERTDIHVDAFVRGATGEEVDTVTVIVEVKGCWHKELWTAMETQLAGRYLKESHARHGLYVVGWFNCPQWNPSDSRRQPTETVQQAQTRLDQQAVQLSREKVIVKALVIDTSLR